VPPRGRHFGAITPTIFSARLCACTDRTFSRDKCFKRSSDQSLTTRCRWARWETATITRCAKASMRPSSVSYSTSIGFACIGRPSCRSSTSSRAGITCIVATPRRASIAGGLRAGNCRMNFQSRTVHGSQATSVQGKRVIGPGFRSGHNALLEVWRYPRGDHPTKVLHVQPSPIYFGVAISVASTS